MIGKYNAGAQKKAALLRVKRCGCLAKKIHIRERYNCLISSTLVSLGLPGRQASS